MQQYNVTTQIFHFPGQIQRAGSSIRAEEVKKKRIAATFSLEVPYMNQHPHINAYTPVSLGRKSIFSLAMGDEKDIFTGGQLFLLFHSWVFDKN